MPNTTPAALLANILATIAALIEFEAASPELSGFAGLDNAADLHARYVATFQGVTAHVRDDHAIYVHTADTLDSARWGDAMITRAVDTATSDTAPAVDVEIGEFDGRGCLITW